MNTRAYDDTDLVLIGDEAYTRDELERLVQKRKRERERDRRYRANPEVRERLRVRHKEYRARNKERLRAYNSAYRRAHRARWYSDEELRSKVLHHQRLVDRYQAELNRRDAESEQAA